MAKPAHVVPYLSPLLRKLKRGPAVTLPKDAGMIIAYTGIGKDSRVIELGSGSGFFTVQLANIVKEVVSYEKRKEFLDIAEGNVKRCGFTNVTFKNQDVLEPNAIDENDCSFDLVFCDIAEADKIAKAAHDALKKDGFLAAHCLHMEQAKALALECQKYFAEVQMVESIVRDYEVRDFGTRPKHMGIMHTAYLVFARK
ncbi:MAG: methyltransferase domain-containing protein [Candidatus Aenigmarchaeota archaeon]|nr:methyltransferase domain-containing protein [Candidatus Aenigmarchaeota archaeon]